MVFVTPTGRVEPVYDLTVDGEHEFFASGVLVHNSSDCGAYGRRLIATLFESGAVEQEVQTAAPGAPPRTPQPGEPPPPAPDRGIYSDPLRVPLHFVDPWGNV